MKRQELVSDHAVDQLERALLHGILADKYKPNEYLPSTDRLCEEFGVSYVTARSAVGRLVSKGLLVVISGQGTRVVDLQSSMDLQILSEIIRESRHEPMRRWVLLAQAFGFLRFLHKEIADRAATHRTDQQLDWLRHLVRLLTDQLDAKAARPEIGEYELRLSRVLAAASGCVTHTAVINSVRPMFVSDVLTSEAQPLIPLHDYWALTDALATCDSARAREVVDTAWWRHEERCIAELKKLGWSETPVANPLSKPRDPR